MDGTKIQITAAKAMNELSENDSELLAEQMDILLDHDTQKQILQALLEQYPKLADSFYMVAGLDAQATFLCKMIREGYVHVYNQAFEQIHAIFYRHPKYKIKAQHISSSFDIILAHVLRHSSVTDANRAQTEKVWRKANGLLGDIMTAAFEKHAIDHLQKAQLTDKAKLANRTRIARSMSDDDIECVTKIWHEMIHDNKEKVGDLLAVRLQKQTQIYVAFQGFGIDVFKQSLIIIDMLDTAIGKLSHTDELVPFLKSLGARHAKMNIKPALLALMKKLILELIKEVLAFNFNEHIKESWNRVLTFIVGMMIMEYSNAKGLNRGSTNSSLHSLVSIESHMKDRYDANDIDFLTQALTAEVVRDCQESWKLIDNEDVIRTAVKSFYTDLLKSRDEIKQLFSSASIAEQSMRLVRAIGSTVNLLNDQETLTPILQELGKRHVYYNVKPNHFKYVKRCWFKMLKKGLTLRWNKRIQNAWNVVWDFMAYHMSTSLEDALLLYVPPDPIEVKFKVLVNHLDHIKLNDLSFFGDIWFAAYTGDNSSQSFAFSHTAVASVDHANGEKLEGTGVLPFGGVRCLNSMQTTDKYRSVGEPYIRHFKEEDTWYLRGNMVGTFSQSFGLHAYPFDTHNIQLMFSLEVDDSIAKFSAEHINVRLMPFKLDAMGGTIFHVHEPQIELFELSAAKGGSSSGKRYTQCRVTIPVSRDYTHYVYNIVIPLIAIEIMAFSVYFTDTYPVVDRMILSITVFLTLFAFRREVQADKPPTPYLSVLDHAFNCANLLSVYHVSGLCFVQHFQDAPREMVKTMNICMGLGAVLIFTLVHTYLFFKARGFISLYPKEKKQLTDNDALRAIAKSALASREPSVMINGDGSEVLSFEAEEHEA